MVDDAWNGGARHPLGVSGSLGGGQQLERGFAGRVGRITRRGSDQDVECPGYVAILDQEFRGTKQKSNE